MTTTVVDQLAAMFADVDRSRPIWRDGEPAPRWRPWVYSCRNDWGSHDGR